MTAARRGWRSVAVLRCENLTLQGYRAGSAAGKRRTKQLALECVHRRKAARARGRRRRGGAPRREPARHRLVDRAARRGLLDVLTRRAASSPTFSLGDPGDPRVVLIPGVTGSKEDFYLLAPILAAGGYFVQSFDLAGQYESADAGPVPGGHYTYELLVADVVAFLRAGAPAHVLGYSFAGILSQLALVEHPAPVPQPDAAHHAAGARAGVPRGAHDRLAQLVPQRPPGCRPHDLGHRHQQEQGAAEPARLRARTVRAHPAFERRRHRRADEDACPTRARTWRPNPIPKLVATGNHDLWPTHLHAAFAAADRGDPRGVPHRAQPLRDGPAPARPRHARAVRRAG